MKISGKIIRIGLVLMVALSLYFSYVIWLSPAGKETVNVDETSSQVMTESQSNRKSSEIFLPLHVTWVQGENIQETNSENLVSRLQTVIGKARFGKLSEVVTGDKTEFDQKKELSEGFELTYLAPFLLQEYIQAFGLNLDVSNLSDDTEMISFTCIQFDEKNKKIRFLDFVHQTIYEANLSLNWEDIKKELSFDENKWTKMSKKTSVIAHQYDTESPIKLKKYSYILSQQPYTLFRNAFFQSPDEVKNNDESSELIFYGGNETMTIHSASQVVDFRGELSDTNNNGNIYSKSFPYISKIGSNLGNLHYFDRTYNQIDYRIFVEGFPVFGTDSKGKVGITINGEATEKTQVNIQTSLNAIQVPIPSDESVELASTADVIQQLVTHGAEKEELESVIIGYTWQNIKETNRVVDLLPEWYVKYQGNWYSASELSNKLAEMGAN